MIKYIQDLIRNHSRTIIKDFTVPQQKAITEVIRGLFTAGTPVLRHLVQDENKTAKKQAEKYAYHLGNINLEETVEEYALKKIKYSISKNTIIAYDLTDISKECAKKMEKISKVFDGSKRKVTNGYTLHGVGINNILVKLKVHLGDKYTLNQIRKNIVKEISEYCNKKGIWVFDRGNDDKQFFKDLRHFLKVRFIARLKLNRTVVIKETGVVVQVEKLQPGKYEIYLLNINNNKVDQRSTFTLIISNHLKDKQPIRLIHNLNGAHSGKEIVTMYLQRWGIENIFKRVKTKFNLEKIRVLKYKRFVNLLALIQFAIIVSSITFIKIQESTNQLIIGVLMLYEKYIKKKSVSFNVDSFISFMKSCLKPLIFRNKSPSIQKSLFSNLALKKLGSF
jgi:hypothetical protein